MELLPDIVGEIFNQALASKCFGALHPLSVLCRVGNSVFKRRLDDVCDAFLASDEVVRRYGYDVVERSIQERFPNNTQHGIAIHTHTSFYKTVFVIERWHLGKCVEEVLQDYNRGWIIKRLSTYQGETPTVLKIEYSIENTPNLPNPDATATEQAIDKRVRYLKNECTNRGYTLLDIF